MNYTVVSLKEARDRFSELVERAALVKETFMVTKFDRPKAVIAPVEEKLLPEKNFSRQALNNFIGIWKNRRDIPDAGRWVSNRRKLESLRLTKKPVS